MKFTVAAASLLAAGVAASPAPVKRATVTPITIKGNAFFAGDKRFYIRGVDYQPGGPSEPKDPIADVEGCKRDIVKFKELGLNTIRVYTVDNSKNHDECMTALAEAGIYLALDVNSKTWSLNRAKIQRSYNKVYLQSVFATIDAFQKYDNTLLFFSANEVLDDPDTSPTAPYVKAVNRDMKSYINARGYRKIPVGYSAADVTANRLEMAQYMNCGPDAARSDFYAFNDYSWCDPDNFETTDWGQKVKNFSDYSQPLFLSEYGCNRNKRVFNQVATLYSDKMSSVYSGGLVYEYTQEEVENFGLVNIKDGKVEERPDFGSLKKAFEKTAIPTVDGGYKTDGKASACPKKSATWEVDMDDNELPAMPDGVADFFKNGAGPGKGLSGGSQDSGSDEVKLADASSGTVTQGATSGGANPTTSKGAAASLHVPEFSAAPLMAGVVVLVSSLLGATLI